MKIMALNSGSSSLKFQVLEMPEETVVTEGIFERIGINDSIFTIKINGEKIITNQDVKDHFVASQMLIEALTKHNIIQSFEEIIGVGHRVVQGADIFKDSVLLTEDVIKTIDSIKSLAPLHNPAGLTCIDAMQKVLPNAKHVAVFDTAFHQTISEEVYMYAVPYEWYTDLKVRKYGMHGTSHKYVSQEAYKLIGKENGNVIVCHIGNGASICAVKDGKSVETSMGLTPLAGLPMGTRSGDIDPGVIEYVATQKNINAAEVVNILNKQSGFLGVSGISSDARDIEKGMKEGNKRCILASELQIKKIVDYIASYYVYMGGVDAICFTAGLGENSPLLRLEVMKRLAVLGVVPNEERNNVRGKTTLISDDSSKVKVYVVPTNEEVVIARDVQRLMNN